MAKQNALPLLLVAGGAAVVMTKRKKKKKKAAESEKPGEGKGEAASPDAAFCIEQGGTPEARFGEEGAITVCVMPDGSEAEGFAFLRGETSPGLVVDGTDVQGKVVVGKVGQTITVRFDEAVTGKTWQPADADEGIAFKWNVTNTNPAAAGSPNRRRYFMFELDKPGRWRVSFELTNLRGGIEQTVTLSLEATE